MLGVKLSVINDVTMLPGGGGVWSGGEVVCLIRGVVWSGGYAWSGGWCAWSGEEVVPGRGVCAWSAGCVPGPGWVGGVPGLGEGGGGVPGSGGSASVPCGLPTPCEQNDKQV